MEGMQEPKGGGVCMCVCVPNNAVSPEWHRIIWQRLHNLVQFILQHNIKIFTIKDETIATIITFQVVKSCLWEF